MTIDGQLAEAGWLVQSRDQMNLGAGLGVAVREFATGIGPVDYALFVDRTLCGVLEAKPDGTTLSGFSDKAERYRSSLDNLGRRTANLQTGDPYHQRVVSLCMFYNRDVAATVESALKREYQFGGLHAQGGTEWHIAPREQIVADIRRISHRLEIDQIRVNASGREVEYLGATLSTNFYGLLTFTIRNGNSLSSR